MCPKDDAHLTLEFKSHYIIKPSFTFEDSSIDYSNTLLGEKGEPVPSGFEYNSEINPQLLDLEHVKDFLINTEMMVS